ncbi:MAG: protease inhibitor I9 family protein, partial [Anaerolineales bacterium]|nr:protease inhibitor I9 family protein [Anaerolineales bacterium]
MQKAYIALFIALWSFTLSFSTESVAANNANTGRISPGLAAEVEAEPTAQFATIVQATGDSAALMAQVEAMGGSVNADLPIVNGFAATLSGDQLARLASSPAVAYISPDTAIRSSNLSNATLDVRISNHDDDAEQTDDGSVWRVEPVIQLTDDVLFGYGPQIVGLRYPNVGIPAGAIITNAYIEFTSDRPSDSFASIDIYGERTL